MNLPGPVFAAARIAAAFVGLCGAGCASGQHDATFNVLVDPPAFGGPFTTGTVITLDADISSVGSATLYGLTLSTSPPSSLPDLSFLSTLQGQAENGSMLTTLVTQDSFPVGQPSVEMTIVYFGDLRPLFQSDGSIQINWSGTTNPAYKGFPAGGGWMLGDVTINAQ
jgi:hypothetical protein